MSPTDFLLFLLPFPINNVFSSFLLLFLFPAIKYFQKQKGMIIL
ncbi:hypothetical protein CK3_09360 [butyrate-producing bacterium SS3/4]|jgi:hypothetical protein|nr:hypothetical protein CK3_09360 [butyrate-producing bacterium SS3/4]